MIWFNLIFLLLLSAGSLSFYISNHLLGSDTPAQDTLYQWIGSAKEAIGDTLFLKADSYYHGGVTLNFKEDHDHLNREGEIEKEEGEHQENTFTDWVTQINQKIQSTQHYHLTQDQQKEMLPFLKWATNLDPYNVNALLTTAYWLESHFNKVEDAIELLQEGRRNNPLSWEIDYQLGLLYFNCKHDYALSDAYFLETIKKIGEKEREGVEKHTLIDSYYHLAESYEHQGKKNDALQVYQQLLSFYKPEETIPLKKIIVDKIKSLQP